MGQVFESLEPVRTEGVDTPVFLINGREWKGVWWDGKYASFGPELFCEQDGVRALIREVQDEFYAKLVVEVETKEGGRRIEAGRRFASFDDAERFATTFDIPVQHASGVKWFQTITIENGNGDYQKWEAVLDDGSKCEIGRFSDGHFHVERKIDVKGRMFALGHNEYKRDNDCWQINSFEAAAIACLSLFALIGDVLGSDDYKRGVADGRRALKSELLAALTQDHLHGEGAEHAR